MMGKVYQSLYIIVLLHSNILGVIGKETNEESHPYFEYIQIFRNIPALFEYLLEALEQRPEILEKNDVTLFKRNIEVNTDQSESANNEKKTEKRGADSDNSKRQDENSNTNNFCKKHTGDSKDVSKTTVAYEYGNSNIIMKGLKDSELETNKVVSNRIVNYDDHNTLADKKNYKREILKKRNSINSRNKRNVESKSNVGILRDKIGDYGDTYFAIENFFGLDLTPEQIEERILTAEKLLEEYNTKKNEED